MREIEFLVWSILDKKFIDIEDESDESYELSYCAGAWMLENVRMDCAEDEAFLYDSDIILLRYTGRKDKNGNKIFAGDVVENDMFGEGFVNRGIVKYGDGTFDDGCYEYIGFYIQAANGYRYESEFELTERTMKFVTRIGNIYESPELLTTKGLK